MGENVDCGSGRSVPAEASRGLRVSVPRHVAPDYFKGLDVQVALETSAAQSAHVPASVAASAGLALASPVQAVYLVAKTTPGPAVKPATQGQCKQQLMLLLKGPHIHFCPALSCARSHLLWGYHALTHARAAPTLQRQYSLPRACIQT